MLKAQTLLNPANELSTLVYRAGSWASDNRHKKIFSADEMAHAREVLEECIANEKKKCDAGPGRVYCSMQLSALCKSQFDSIEKNQISSRQWNERVDAQMAVERDAQVRDKEMLSANEQCVKVDADQLEINEIAERQIPRVYRLLQAGETGKVCSEAPRP